VAYRDDNESLRARVNELEHELAGARRALGAPRLPKRLPFGAPLVLEETVEVAAELDDSHVEALVLKLRQALGELGRFEKLSRSYSWTSAGRTGRLIEMTCVVNDGVSSITLRERLGPLAGALFGGIGGGFGGGMLGGIVPLWLALRLPGELMPFAIIAWLLLVFALVRLIFAAVARRRAHRLHALCYAIERVLLRALDGQGKVQSR
jgi:hypothetical protein